MNLKAKGKINEMSLPKELQELFQKSLESSSVHVQNKFESQATNFTLDQNVGMVNVVSNHSVAVNMTNASLNGTLMLLAATVVLRGGELIGDVPKLNISDFVPKFNWTE